MDAWAWITSQIGMFAIGAILLLIGYGYFKMGFSAKSLKLARFAGIILVVLAVLSYAGINLFSTQEKAPASTVGSFTVTASDNLAQITCDNNAKLITWAIGIGNYSTPAFTANSQYCQVTFVVQRGLGTVGLVQTYGDVTSVPSVTNGTTGVSYPVLTQTSGVYNAIWTRADLTTAYNMVTITIAETADGATVTLNMTASLSALSSMSQYGVQNIGLTIGGEVWTVQLLDST